MMLWRILKIGSLSQQDPEKRAKVMILIKRIAVRSPISNPKKIRYANAGVRKYFWTVKNNSKFSWPNILWAYNFVENAS